MELFGDVNGAVADIGTGCKTLWSWHMICSQKACHAFPHFIEIFTHLVLPFSKINIARFVTKSYRKRDNDDDEEDLARIWTIRISLEARSS